MNWTVKWYDSKFAKSTPVILPVKLDGISIELNYTNGLLDSGITRGDGFEGEVITPNVLKMQNVKQELNQPYTGSLRGEIIMTDEDFQKFHQLVANTKPLQWHC